MRQEQRERAPQTQLAEEDKTTGNFCRTGGCGGAGMCPGIALFLAGSFGIGIAGYFDVPWLAWLTGVPVFLLLVTGYWHRWFLR